jgi:quinoprotein glucose dehydrogenase
MLSIPPPIVQEDAYAPFVAEASAEGRAAIAGFEVPDGFTVEQWAAEPMLANPVVFQVDHAGDVYVCESFRVHAGVTDMREHMDWLADELDNLTVADRVAMYRRNAGAEGFAAYGTEHERIRLIRDTDGDGVADRATVFADGFRDPADGIAAGVLSYRGDVFYTCIPTLWRLRDADADGVADERDALSTGYGVHVALLGHDMHGLCIGPDGRLYWSIGDRGFRVEHERKVFDLPHEGAVLRCALDGSGLEVVHTGLRNPQELAFDDRGDLFTGDNNSDGGDEARWVQVVEGADSGWRFYYQYVTAPVLRGPWNDELLWKPHHAGQPAYVLPPIANLANGPSGLEYYPGTGLPERYAKHFFLCDFRGDKAYSGVHAFANVDRGAGFALGPVEPFVWKSLVTDCQFGPDGAFYWSDWVEGWGMTGKGRIYRMTSAASDADASRAVEELLGGALWTRANGELGALLSHADRRVRQEAHLELARRGDRAHLAGAALRGAGRARLHGLWGLWAAAVHDEGLRGDVGDLARMLLTDDEPEVRAQAARVLGEVEHVPSAGELIDHLRVDESARVRLRCALALARIAPRLGGERDVVRIHVLRAVREVGDSDPVLRHGLVMALAACASADELAKLADDDSPHARLAAVLALRRQRSPALAPFLRDSDARIVREAATAIHDERIEGALPALADLIEFPSLAGNAAVRRVLHANEILGGDARALLLAAFAKRVDRDETHRAEALTILRTWADPPDVDRVLGRWLELAPRDASHVPAFVADLTSDRAQPEAVMNAWIETAAAVGADVVPVMIDLLRDRAASTRIAALGALEKLAGPGDALRSAVGEALIDGDGLVRAAALDALGRLAPADALPLVTQVLARGERAERRAAYRLLGGIDHAEARRLLAGELEKLNQDLIPAELALDLVLAAERQDAESLAPWLAQHRAPRLADPALAPWLDSLFGGDAAEGRRIFREQSDLSCLRCHQTQVEGTAQIGPNLAGVAKRLTRLQMLESIVQPNRRVAAGFETETFFLTDGSVREGRVIEESGEAVALVDSQGAVFDVALADLDERRPGLSAMPDGLTDHLSREELRDLLEYLAGL